MPTSNERELKYLYGALLPPKLPAGWSLGPEAAPITLEDTYLDADGQLAAAGWALRRRSDESGIIVFTLKHDATTDGALHRRTETEVVVSSADGGPEPTIPSEIRAIVGTVLGTDLVARLRPTVSLLQRRQAWGLTRQGQTVATMSIDQVSANGTHWTELEIELAASLPDREVEHLVTELRDELERSPQISISTETKPERASRRSV